MSEKRRLSIQRDVILLIIAHAVRGEVMPGQSEGLNTVGFMRESAQRLRRIAIYSSFLAPQLLNMALELEDRAKELEKAGA
jgi:hypothetical protein